VKFCDYIGFNLWKIGEPAYLKAPKIKKESLFTSDDNVILLYQKVLDGDLKQLPSGIWQGKGAERRAAELVRYLIESVLKWTDEDIRNKFSSAVLQKYKLKHMLTELFASSPWKALNNAYPGRFGPKELNATYQRSLTLEEETERLKKLLSSLNHDEILEKYGTANFILENRFDSIGRKYNIGKYEFLDLAYPGEFVPWEFQVSSGYWSDPENRIAAIHWLMDKCDTIALNSEMFIRYGVHNMLKHYELPLLENALAEALNIPDNETFIKMLEEKLDKISVEELAARLNIGKKKLKSWLNREIEPSVLKVVKFYDVFGIDLRHEQGMHDKT
jgi:hypothetical protein